MLHFRSVSLALLASAPLLFAFSCQKDDETPADVDGPDTEIANDAALADDVAEEMTQLTTEAVASGQITGYTPAGGYPRVTRLNRVAANPDTLILDFGPTNLAGPYGRLRRGQIVSVYSGPYGSAPITTTPTNYYVNDHQVTGTRTVTFSSPTRATLVTNLRIQLSGSGTIAYQATRTREQVAGAATPAAADDAFVLNGTAEVTGPRGVQYAATTQDLRRQVACTQFVSGTLTVTRRQDTARGVRIDYGSGTCDNAAQGTLLASGRTFAITLR